MLEILENPENIEEDDDIEEEIVASIEKPKVTNELLDPLSKEQLIQLVERLLFLESNLEGSLENEVLLIKRTFPQSQSSVENTQNAEPPISLDFIRAQMSKSINRHRRYGYDDDYYRDGDGGIDHIAKVIEDGLDLLSPLYKAGNISNILNALAVITAKTSALDTVCVTHGRGVWIARVALVHRSSDGAS